jgi:hypothetical protein
MCLECAETKVRAECTVRGCYSNRVPGYQFCARCLEEGAVVLPVEGWFNQFLEGSKVPQAAFERMCPEAQVEIEREFARRTTLQWAGRGRWRINWPFILKTVSDAAPFAAMGALFALFAYGAFIAVLGFAPGNGGVTFGGVR